MVLLFFKLFNTEDFGKNLFGMYTQVIAGSCTKVIGK